MSDKLEPITVLDMIAGDMSTSTPCSVCGKASRAHLVAWILEQRIPTGHRYDSVVANGDFPIVLCAEHADMARNALEELFASLVKVKK